MKGKLTKLEWITLVDIDQQLPLWAKAGRSK